MVRPFQAIVLVAVLTGMPFVAVGSARAQFDSVQKQAECELSAIRDTRSAFAINWIRTACNRLATDTGLLNEGSRAFYTCVVNYLSGVQDDAAANRVIQLCRSTYPQ